MTTHPDNNNPYGNDNGQNPAPGQPNPQHPYGTPAYGVNPELAKQQKDAKTSGILSIVFGAVAFIILPFLSLAGLVAGIRGLKLSNKLAAAGVLQNSKGLNLAGIVISSISVALWILGLVLRASGVV